MRIIILAFTFFNIGCTLFNKYDPEDLSIQYPVVYELIKNDKVAEYDFVHYADLLNRERRIRKFHHLENIYTYRDSFIIPSISLKLEENEMFYEDNSDKLIKELAQLGVHISSAEGIFGSVGPKLILEEKLKKLAPTDYRLYQKFIHYRSFTKDGEYPFIDMQAEINMIRIGERFLKDHFRSSYWPIIEPDFHNALGNFISIHEVREDNASSYRVGGTYLAYWPFSTQMKERQKFIDSFPESRFSTILKKVIDNPSLIDVNKEELYIIVTDWHSDHLKAKDKRKDYFLDKQDIPHILEVKRSNGEIMVANVYRFHSDKMKAEEFLGHIKKGHPKSELLKVRKPGDTVLKEIR